MKIKYLVIILALFAGNAFPDEVSQKENLYSDFSVSCKTSGKVTQGLLDGKSSEMNIIDDNLPDSQKIFSLDFFLSTLPGTSKITLRNKETEDEEVFFELTKYRDFPLRKEWILRNNYLSAGNNSSELSMKRYHKNDWQLEIIQTGLSSKGHDYVTIFHGNCMNMPNDYEKYLKKKKSFK